MAECIYWSWPKLNWRESKTHTYEYTNNAYMYECILRVVKFSFTFRLVAALSDVSVLSKEKTQLEESLAVQQSRL